MRERLLRFATPVHVWNMETALPLFDNDALIADILKWKEVSDGETRSNRNGVWHSLNAVGRPAFKPLVQEIFRFFGHIFQKEGYREGSVVRIEEMWANVVPPGGYHTQHTHGGCLWSGIYYAQVPEGSGKLFLRDPRVQMDFWAPKVANQPAETDSFVKIKPKVGRMVAFPSWVSHRVDAGTNEESRIAVSFNISQVKAKKEKAKDPKVPVCVAVPKVLDKDDITKLYSQLSMERDFKQGMTGSGMNPDIRQSSIIFLDHARDEKWRWLFEKIEAHAVIVNREVYKVGISQTEPMQVSRYLAGDKYNMHTDSGRFPGGQKRTMSCVVSLRMPQEGGGIGFERRSDGPVVQEPGDAVFFRADERHTALEVQQGCRESLTVWFSHE